MSGEPVLRSISEVILSLSQNLSLEKLIKKDKILQIAQVLIKLEDVKFLVFESETFQLLKGKLFCSFCLERPPDVLNACGHKFCSDCLLIMNMQDEPRDSQALCPLCADHLALQSSAQAFDECAGCNVFLHFSYFQVQLSCHKVCNICVKEISDFQCLDCKTCSSVISEKSYLFTCFRCRRQVDLSDSFFLCYIHCFCFECSLVCLDKGKCFECGTKIKDSILSVIKSSLNLHCCMCKTTKNQPLFMKKTCCYSKVCLSCQFSRSETFCISCNSELIKN